MKKKRKFIGKAKVKYSVITSRLKYSIEIVKNDFFCFQLSMIADFANYACNGVDAEDVRNFCKNYSDILHISDAESADKMSVRNMNNIAARLANAIRILINNDYCFNLITMVDCAAENRCGEECEHIISDFMAFFSDIRDIAPKKKVWVSKFRKKRR